MSMIQKLLVLGGGGFLGSHLVRALLARPIERLTVVDTCLDKLHGVDDGAGRLVCHEGSIRDEALVESLLDTDAVVSLTALCNPSLYNTRPRQVIDANFTDLVPLVDQCTARGLWLIHFSTCEVYGKPDPSGGAMNEEHSALVLGPVQRERWSYACAKQLLERLLWAQHRHAGLPCTIIRPFNVIGPRMDFIPGVDGEGVPRVVACFIADLLRQRPLRLVDGGAHRRAFIAVEDFVEAVLAVLARPAACQGQILNVGNPENDVTIAELARLMIAHYARQHGGRSDLPCESVTAEEFYGEGYDDAAWRIPDIHQAQRLLDWRPRRALVDVVGAVIDDYVERYGGRL